MGQSKNPKRSLKYLQLNENENTINFCFDKDALKVLKGKLIVLNAYFRKEEKSKISILSST